MIIIATHGRGMWVFDMEQIDQKPKPSRGAGVSKENQKALFGSWVIDSDAGFSFNLKFSLKEGAVVGAMSFQMGEAELSDINFDGKTLTFKAAFSMGDRQIKIDTSAQIEGEKLTGTLSSPMGKVSINGEREKTKN